MCTQLRNEFVPDLFPFSYRAIEGGRLTIQLCRSNEARLGCCSAIDTRTNESTFSRGDRQRAIAVKDAAMFLTDIDERLHVIDRFERTGRIRAVQQHLRARRRE